MNSINSAQTSDVCRHRQGMVLIGHGTRDRRGIDEFFATAALVAERLTDVAVEPCFLELAEPGIDEAIERLVAKGAEQIVVSPLLLFAAGHAKQDIPNAVTNAAQKFPHLHVRQTRHLGLHPHILRASADRFFATINESPKVAAKDCALLMIGRGSLDDEATAEMKAFAEERASSSFVQQVATCFVAMAEPTFDEAIATLMESRPKTIIVQPHLLFHGELLATVQQFVENAVRRFARPPTAETQWRMTKHLATDPLIADAIVDLFHSK